MDSRTINDVKVDDRMNELRLIEIIVELIIEKMGDVKIEPILMVGRSLDEIIPLAKRLSSIDQDHTIEFNNIFNKSTYSLKLADQVSEYNLQSAALDVHNSMSSLYKTSTALAFNRYTKILNKRNRRFVELIIQEYFSGIIYYEELVTFGVFDLIGGTKEDVFELLKCKDCTSDEDRMNKVMLWKLSKE